MGVAATNHPAVNGGHASFCPVRRRRAKRLRLRLRIVAVQASEKGAELVVFELLLRKPRSLLENDHGESGGRKLFGQNAASGTRPDDHEIDDVARTEASRRSPCALQHV